MAGTSVGDLEWFWRSFPGSRSFKVEFVEHLCSILPDFNWQRAHAVYQRQLGFLYYAVLYSVWHLHSLGQSVLSHLCIVSKCQNITLLTNYYFLAAIYLQAKSNCSSFSYLTYWLSTIAKWNGTSTRGQSNLIKGSIVATKPKWKYFSWDTPCHADSHIQIPVSKVPISVLRSRPPYEHNRLSVSYY